MYPICDDRGWGGEDWVPSACHLPPPRPKENLGLHFVLALPPTVRNIVVAVILNFWSSTLVFLFELEPYLRHLPLSVHSAPSFHSTSRSHSPLPSQCPTAVSPLRAKLPHPHPHPRQQKSLMHVRGPGQDRVQEGPWCDAIVMQRGHRQHACDEGAANEGSGKLKLQLVTTCHNTDVSSCLPLTGSFSPAH